MRAEKKITTILTATIVVVTILGGCSLALFEGSTATLLISLAPRLTARTIAPTMSMEADHFVVTGDGPGTASFEFPDVDPATTLIEQPSLVPGLWLVMVDAYNADGDLIGSGEVLQTLTAGQVLEVTVEVVPLVGDGDLNLDIFWVQGILADPSFEASLTPMGESYDPALHDISLDLLVDPTDLEYDPAQVRYRHKMSYPNGYYRLSLLLKEGGEPVWGTVESVRILKGKESIADIELVEDLNRIGVAMPIDLQLNNPVELVFTSERDVFDVDGSVYARVEARDPVTGEPAEVENWTWYLQAVMQTGSVDSTTNSSIEIEGLEAGFYTLSVLAAAGDALAAASFEFQVTSEGALFFGPTNDPPGGFSVTSPEPTEGLAGGRTITYSDFDTSELALLIWTLDVSTPFGFAYDGVIDRPEENFAFDAGASNLANGLLVFTGSSIISFYDHRDGSYRLINVPLDTRLTVTVTNTSSGAIPLYDPALAGLDPAHGGLHLIAGQVPGGPPIIAESFSVNFLVEARDTIDFTELWRPAWEIYNDLHTQPTVQTLTSIPTGFLYMFSE